MTIRAYGQRSLKRLANIDVINGYGKLLTFKHVGSHVDERRYCQGATVVHHISDEWDIQLIMWGEPLPEDKQRQVINDAIGLDR